MVVDIWCEFYNDELCDFLSMSGVWVEEFIILLNFIVGCKWVVIFLRLYGSSNGRGGVLLNGLVEIEVVLIGKWNVNMLEEVMVLKLEIVD